MDLGEIMSIRAKSHLEGYEYGVKSGIDGFVEYLNNNVFELRHDMELIKKAAEEYKKRRFEC